MRFRLRLNSSIALMTLGVLLGACNNSASPSRSNPNRAYLPLTETVKAELAAKGFSASDPILVRIFKEESELEVWKKKDGQFTLFKTYPICKWSGELGPKVSEGDRQAPEGFYTITPAQMNPNSNYYLSFNMGFPNKFDSAYGRYGSHLMVHGDCSSRGCYAMTDSAIAEVYGLAREALAAGQPAFQVQALPFRMSPKNFARHRANPHMAFWRNLKEGNDHFLVTQQEPKVDVCERRYVFNSEGGSLSPTGSCASYKPAQHIVAAVKQKDTQDMAEVAQLSLSVAQAPVKFGLDGGKHTSFGGVALASITEPAPAPAAVKPAQAAKPGPIAPPSVVRKPATAVANAPEPAAPSIANPPVMAYASNPAPSAVAGFAAKLNPVRWFGAEPPQVEAPVTLPSEAPLPQPRAALKLKRLPLAAETP